VRWTAPEALEDRKFSEKTDAWSFGVTLYEIWTKAAPPYGNMNNQKVWVEVAHGMRLSQPEICSAEVYAAMTACWAEAQGQRPSMRQMTELLRRLYESYTGERAPAPQGHASEYETPVSCRHNSAYSDAQPTRCRLPGVYVSVDSGCEERSQVHERSLAGAGSMVGVQMQNPVFNASPRTAGENRALLVLNGSRAIHGTSSTDDESAALYDIGSVVETGSPWRVSASSSSHHEMKNTAKDASRGGTEAEGAIYDLGSTDTANIDRLQTESLQQHKVASVAPNIRLSPTVTKRVPNLAWEEEPESMTGAGVLPEVKNVIYDNEVKGTSQGPARRAVTASDIGRRVLVQGYSCSGVLRFIGPHHERGTLRCGVELDEAMGKNDGTVGVSAGGDG
jgi:hypothetical protein